jgi:hypothetical protein
MTTNTTLLMLAILVVAAASAGFLTHEAFAKITPGSDASCTNGGGNEPGGQQPNCQGGGLTQNPETPATNPAGNEPPGQQDG